MRVKRVFLLSTLAIGVLVFLSSCDLFNYLLANGKIAVTVRVSTSHPGATDSRSYVDVSINDSSGTTYRCYYSGTSGTYAIYHVPEFDKLQDGYYTITATFNWPVTSPLPGFSWSTTSTTVDLPDNGSESTTTTLTF